MPIAVGLAIYRKDDLYIMIGYALTGSFCTVGRSLEVLGELVGQYDVLPIISESVRTTDTRFGKAADTMKRLEELCGRPPITSIKEAEPLGPKIKLDALIIAPCTGNTLAKMANGITDTAVTMAAKAHRRNGRPLIVALATNDGLSQNLCNISTVMNRKNVYFVPFGQDDPEGKPNSLVADLSLTAETLRLALEGKQLQPIINAK